MGWIVMYFVLNIIIAIVIYTGWDKVDNGVDFEDLYEKTSVKTVKVTTTIMFVLFGLLFVLKGVINKVFD